MIHKPNLYTQKAFAKLVKLTPARINQMVKEDNLPDNTRLINIKGGFIIEVKS